MTDDAPARPSDPPSGAATGFDGSSAPTPAPERPPATPEPPRGRPNRAVYVVIGLAALGLLGVNVVRWVTEDGDSTTSGGVAVEDLGVAAMPRPSFALTDVEGAPFEFADRTSGQLTFLFFGYTNCPDVCPIQMATLSAALDEMPEVSAQIVFVTTDPARDDPARLRTWLSSFPGNVVGLTGSPEDIATAETAARVTGAVTGEADGAGRYEVGHATSVLVYSADDRLVGSVPSGTTQQEWTDAILELTATS